MTDVNTITHSIADAISNTLSPNAAQRRTAESFLSQRESDTQDFPLIILRLVSNTNIPDHVRQACAVYLKNVTSRAYSNEDGPGQHSQSFDHIKSSIIDIMLVSSPPIRRPLGQVLSSISEHDHPHKWPDLISALANRLQTIMTTADSKSSEEQQQIISYVDWISITAILETLNSVFDRYPERMRSNKLYTEINHSLQHSQQHILSLFNLISRVLDEDFTSNDFSLIQSVLTTSNILCRVFYSLSWQDLPEFFEDNITQYMSSLRKLLTFKSDVVDQVDDDDDDDQPGLKDKVDASVLEIANLYATKYDEDFRKFLPQFMSDAWQLLIHRGNPTRFDIVVTTGIKFLSSVARSPDSHLFNEPNALTGVCTKIVVPNIQLREEDIEMFEDDPREYVRHDLEGSDTGTRRRGAVELVKALCTRYEKEVTEIFSSFVRSIFSPETDWRDRDTAIYLVIALGWKTGTLMRGVTETSSLIDISHFFTSFVNVELFEAAKNAKDLKSPIFTADLIKFVLAFRHQISVQGCKEALATCGKLIAAKEPVVRTYAAACVERILTMRQSEASSITENANANSKLSNKKLEYRIGKGDVVPLLPSILPLVIDALKESGRPDEYMMRLVLRLCSFCRDGMGPHVESILPTLVELLKAATENPANPLFNHYLFETFAALIRFNATTSTISAFEHLLMSPFCNILIADVTEFGPYVFQILSQMMNVHNIVHNGRNLPEQYDGLIGPILNPVMWERRAYTAAMVLYIETYIKKSIQKLIANKQLEATLGVFQKLIASKVTDKYGLHLLCKLFENIELNQLSPYIQTIFSALMLRLSNGKTTQYVYNLLVALSTFVIRFGVDMMKQAFDGIQPNLLGMLLQQVWINDVVKIRDSKQRKICAIGLSELACGSDTLWTQDPYLSIWPSIITANVALVEGIVVDDDDKLNEQQALEEEEEADVLVGAAETYASSQSLLRWGLGHSGASNELIDGNDARAVVFLKVVQFVEKHKQTFEPILQEKVSVEARKALSGYENVAKASVAN